MNAKDLENAVKSGNMDQDENGEIKTEDGVTPETETAEEKTEEAVNEEAEGASEEGSEETSEETSGDASEEEDDASEKEESPKKEKKPFFKKKDKRDEQIAELSDRLLRHMAEFDNYRRRTDTEKAASFDIGQRALVEKILPVIDNFERGLATLSEEEKGQPFATGMDKIYRQMLDILTSQGLKEIEALNTEFNPDYHNAVMHVDDDSVGENIVVEVFQKGYIYKDVVVRHAMVKVAN